MTAGCDDITGPLLHFDANHGCPSTCTAVHSKQLASIPCTDVAADDPNLKALVAGYMQHFDDGRNWFAAKVGENGCAWLSSPLIKDQPGFSTDDVPNCEYLFDGVKSPLTLCPVTCGCAQKKGSIQCPATCSNDSAH